MKHAIEAVNVTKVYRKYARKKQFATLKSALLSGSLVHRRCHMGHYAR